MTYRFGDCELDTGLHELRRSGHVCPVEPQVFDLLLYLIERRDRMVSKVELNQRIWQGRFVSDAALSACIKMARRAIGDSGKKQDYIQTFSRRGFRFVGHVEVHGQNHGRGSPTSAELGSDVKDHPALSDKPTVAVMSFKNLSDKPDRSHFAAAITYDLVSALLRHRWLSVISAANMLSSGRYSMIRDGEVVESNADYLVLGDVRASGDRLRISVQLMDTNSREYIWSNSYDRKINNVFLMQDEITGTIAGHIEPEIGARERHRVLHRPTSNMGAWDCFHLGLAHFYKFTNQDFREAQRLFSRSLELDPDFGEGHAWWALLKIWSTFYFEAEPSELVLEQALRLAKRAIEIDDQNAIFHFLLARVHLARCEYAKGLAEIDLSLMLNPNFAGIHCGLGDALTYEARYDESFVQFEKALRLGPRDPFRWAYFGYGALAYLFSEQFETAINWAEGAIRHPRCQFWAFGHRAAALGHLGLGERAHVAVADLINQQPKFCRRYAAKKLYFIKRPEQLQLYLDGLRKAGVPE